MKLIIRTAAGQPLSAAMENSIKKLTEATGEIVIEYQSAVDQELFLHSYKQRIQSVTDAAKLLV